MAIWVDADACPRVIKDILFRAAVRTEQMLTLVANQPLTVPASAWIRTIQVAQGFDVADQQIVRSVARGDLVVTQDIPLAAELVELGAVALSPRGEPFSPETIREQLAMRDLLDGLRSSGIETGGPAAFSDSDRRAFASQLDRYLAHLCDPR